MNPSFENSIPIELIVAGFVVLFILGNILQRKLRKKNLNQQGQLDLKNGKAPTLEERVSKNKSWASGKITSSGLIYAIILWVCSLVWCLTFGVAFIKSFSNPSIPVPAKIFLGVISLGGIAFIYFAARFTIRHFRFGKSYCLINGKAGVLGKEMSGIIKTSVKIQATGDYKLLLQCLETYSTGSGKNSKTQVNVIYQDKKNVPSASISSLSGIPFKFQLPSIAHETGYQLARGRIDWQLSVDAPVEGVDYAAIFRIPVFKID